MLEVDSDNPANLYCAGLFEGEGCITCTVKPKGKNNFLDRSLQLKISMTDSQPLSLFEDIMQVGKVYGPYINSNNKLGTKAIYMYVVTKPDEIKYIMESMWNWLSDKRKEQYEVALKKFETWGS